MKFESAAFLALAATASASLYTSDVAAQRNLWEQFKTQYNHKFSAEEDATRFSNFLENLKIADIRNVIESRAGGSAVHGITQFSHLTASEFHAQYLTADTSLKTTGGSDCKVDNSKAVDNSKGLVDWTNVLTTPVKNQGSCGSCWAFSAITQVESDYMRAHNGKVSALSAQQVVSCATLAFGCDGGWTETAYSYIMGNKAHGLETESQYPYTSGANGVTGACRDSTPTDSKFTNISGYCTIKGEDKMAAYMQNHGPLSICIDATTWSSYTGGVMSACGNSVNHCVQAVGVSTKDGYWKVRNQWGITWGEAGHIRLAYGKDTCSITNDPTYTNVTN